MPLNRRHVLLSSGAAVVALSGIGPGRAATPVPALKDRFKDHFRIGMALDPRLLAEPVIRGLVARQASCLAPENVMKPDLVGVREGVYNFKPAEDLMAFAEAQGIAVRGTTLVWHRTAPDWFFAGDQTDMTACRAVVRRRLERYVTDVVTHFKGRVYAWDVVNEVTADSGDSPYRDTRWYQVLGPDYIDCAFRAARAADPEAQLFINDYLTEAPEKRACLLAIVDGLLARGVPVDGVGHQCHMGIVPRAWTGRVSHAAGDVDAALTAVEARGLVNHISELDVSLYADPLSCFADGTGCLPAPSGAELAAALQVQAESYRSLFAVFAAHASVKAVMLWGVADSHTWLDDYPLKRPNRPLLFDARGLPKPAFWAVVGGG